MADIEALFKKEVGRLDLSDLFFSSMSFSVDLMRSSLSCRPTRRCATSLTFASGTRSRRWPKVSGEYKVLRVKHF